MAIDAMVQVSLALFVIKSITRYMASARTTFTTHTISVVFTKSSSVSSTYCTEKTDSIAPMTSSIAAQSHDSFTGSSSFTFTSPKYAAANKRITHQLADVK